MLCRGDTSPIKQALQPLLTKKQHKKQMLQKKHTLRLNSQLFPAKPLLYNKLADIEEKPLYIPEGKNGKARHTQDKRKQHNYLRGCCVRTTNTSTTKAHI